LPDPGHGLLGATLLPHEASGGIGHGALPAVLEGIFKLPIGITEIPVIVPTGGVELAGGEHGLHLLGGKILAPVAQAQDFLLDFSRGRLLGKAPPKRKGIPPRNRRDASRGRTRLLMKVSLELR